LRKRAKTALSLTVLALSVIGLFASYSAFGPKAIGVIYCSAGIGKTASVVETLAAGSSPFGIQLDQLGFSRKNSFDVTADAKLGKWSANVDYQPSSWTAGTMVRMTVSLRFSETILSGIKEIAPKIDRVCILVTAERNFDANGLQRIPNHERVSTLLTPSGLPIEGGGTAAVSRFTGYFERGPIDIMIEAPLEGFVLEASFYSGTIPVSFSLPQDLPPGIYRLRLDFGLKSGQRRVNFNGDSVGNRPRELKDVSCVYSPTIPASGRDAAGKEVDASKIRRRCYWILLWDYNSNGYRGVVAQEDQSRVSISPRHIMQDDVVLPRFGLKGAVIAYNLEPCFLMDGIDSQRNIPWRYDTGEWSVKVTQPDRTTVDLGTARFVAKRGNGATTKNAKFTSWKPPAYGRYEIEATGWIEDAWGNRYEGGGKYSFWIAKRMTLATATFQGQAYNVGNRYGRDIGFAPAVPADVVIRADLYVNSDPKNVRTVISTGRATLGGVYGAAQGMKPLLLDAPGEYHAKVTATYWDSQGHLWVCVMRHAGVVYPENSPIIAHGKKLFIQGKFVDRGETHFEGYIAEQGDLRFLDHVGFPYNSGDALLIASEQQGANKIINILTYEEKGKNMPYDPAWRSFGRTNIRIKTSNGLLPEMFPEYITDWAYYYASGPRPGFMSRFVVGHDNVAFPYWPTSRSNFGGQYGASYNGDLPGDIYRLLGGVVLRPKDQAPAYAGYQASAFILPKGTNNNRVIGPGVEDLPSPDGKPARFFLVAVRPGMVYDVGTAFRAVLQIDPIVPCDVTFTLTAPDGSERMTEGKGDQFGYFAGKESWLLDKPGVWIYRVKAKWNGYEGRVPGLPETGGYIFVTENSTAPGRGLNLKMMNEQQFSPLEGMDIRGETSASEVYYAAITPGAILEQGTILANNGEFRYKFDVKAIAERIQTYDIIDLTTGKPQIGRIVHLTFFTQEKGTIGPYHSFVRVIFRGTTAVYVK